MFIVFQGWQLEGGNRSARRSRKSPVVKLEFHSFEDRFAEMYEESRTVRTHTYSICKQLEDRKRKPATRVSNQPGKAMHRDAWRSSQSLSLRSTSSFDE